VDRAARQGVTAPVRPAEPDRHPRPRRPPRIASLVGHSRRRAEAARAWAEAARGRSPVVARAFEVAERDCERLGGLLAGAVAYRFFLWLLPFSLLIVGLLGAITDLDDDVVEDAGGEIGLQGALTRVIAEGARQSGWWIAMVIGLVGTAYAGLGAVRALRVSHAAAWDIRPARPASLVNGSLAITGIALGLIATNGLIGWLRERSGAGGLIASLAVLGVYFTAWLRISVHLPRRPTPVRALVPGAVLVAVGAEALHLFTAYYLAGQADRVSSVYGTIGMALTLLLWLFIVSRLLVGSAILNATLWERRAAGRARTRVS
jgi:uncharacterized BrkB/YihY/UPF0761 family membrane protein